MNLIALKMLIGDRLKYIGLVAGVAFAALLITQQASIFMGFSGQIGVWIRGTAVGDLWVFDNQVQFDNDFKPMREGVLYHIRGIEGIAWAVPMYKNYLQARLPDGTRVLCRVIGLDDATLAGGPPEITHGKLWDLRSDRAVFINEDEAKTTLRLRRGEQRPLRVGDRISLNDHEAIVVGTFKSPKEFFWDPVIYTTYTRALSWAPPERRQLMYIHVKVADGHDPAKVAARIIAQTGMAALTNAEYSRLSTDQLLGHTGILINFGITVALGFLIGMLVAGQTFYSFVLENLRHFGALKAMGASNFTVLRMIVLQVMVVGGVGYGLGLGTSSVIGVAFGGGKLAFAMTWHIPVAGLIGVIVCCCLAGFLGAVQVLRLEPAVVFKT